MVNVGLKTCEYPAHIPQRLFGRALPGPWLSKAGSRLLLVEPDSLGREAVEDATELHLSARCCAPCTYLHQNLPNAFSDIYDSSDILTPAGSLDHLAKSVLIRRVGWHRDPIHFPVRH